MEEDGWKGQKKVRNKEGRLEWRTEMREVLGRKKREEGYKKREWEREG